MPRSNALLLLALASLASACARGGSSSPAGPVRGGATSAREVVQEMQGEWGGKLFQSTLKNHKSHD